jgi:hypothetical protein
MAAQGTKSTTVAKAMAGRQDRRGRKSNHPILFTEGNEEKGDENQAPELSAFVSSLSNPGGKVRL